MFEQELYESETSASATQPGDLFHNYEIKNWNFTGRIYKILALSAIGNILALMVIGTSGVLTARGCDSPFVGRVCQVLDTVYVGALIFGTESEYADVDYTKTELEDADVTFVDVTGVTPPLSYPEGYFQLANPEQQFTNLTDPNAPGSGFLAPGIPGNPTIGGSGLINTPPVAPPVNDNPIIGDLGNGGPLGPLTDNPTTSGRKGRGRRGPLAGQTPADTNANTNVPNANTSNPTVAGNKEEAQADENGVFLNKRPLRDKTTDTLAQVDAGSVALDKTFRVVITGTLGLAEDGKTIVLKNPKPAPDDKNFPSDPALTKLAQEWVVAVGDAGWYGYLGFMDEKRGIGRLLTITIEQNDTTFLANVRSELPSANRANTMATGLRNAMTIGAFRAKPDELVFLQSTKTTSEGNFVVVNLQMPKNEAQEIIQRKLAEFKAKEPKPEGNADMRPSNNTAKK